MVSRKPSRATQLERASLRAQAANDALRSFIDRYSAFYEELTALQEDVAQATNALKDVARSMSVIGKTVEVVNTPGMFVSVLGKQESVQYDVEKALSSWPADVLDRVVKQVIDTKKVEALLDAGVLKDEVVMAAALPRKAMTPAVTVRFKDG